MLSQKPSKQVVEVPHLSAALLHDLHFVGGFVLECVVPILYESRHLLHRLDSSRQQFGLEFSNDEFLIPDAGCIR